MPEDWIRWIHLGATWFMTGLIVYVQVVHYPMIRYWSREAFPAAHAAHSRLTGYVVGPVMVAELATAIALVVWKPAPVPAWVVWAGLGAVVALWISTAFLQVPRHRRLDCGFDADAYRELVRGNMLRAVLWPMRAVLAVWIVIAARGGA